MLRCIRSLLVWGCVVFSAAPSFAETAGSGIILQNGTITFDPTDFGVVTWGAAATFTWTFNTTAALDPAIEFASGTIRFHGGTSATYEFRNETAGALGVFFDDFDNGSTEDARIRVDCVDTTTDDCSFRIGARLNDLDDQLVFDAVAKAEGDNDITIGAVTTNGTDTITLAVNGEVAGNTALDVPDNSINLTTGAGQEVTGVLPAPNGGTGANLTVTDDDVLVGTAGGIFALDDVPDCDLATDAVTYDITTNNFACHAITGSTLAYGILNATNDGAGNGNATANASPDTLEIIGDNTDGVDGIEIVCESAGAESCTWSFDASEVNTETWGSGGGPFTWTIDTGVDPDIQLAFGADSLGLLSGDGAVRIGSGASATSVAVNFDDPDASGLMDAELLVNCPDTTSPVNCSAALRVSTEVAAAPGSITWAEIVGIAGGTPTVNVGNTTGVTAINLQTSSTGDAELDVPDNSINLTTGAGQEVTGILPGPNGGTGANLTITDDDVLVGTAGGVFALDDVPDCDAATDAVTYDITTNNFACHAISGSTLAFGTLNATNDGAGNGSAVADAAPDAVEVIGDNTAGVDGVDVICEDVGAESCTWSFDASEVNTETWGAGGAVTWTFDSGTNDNTLTFGENVIIYGTTAGDPQLQFDHPTGTGANNSELMVTCADAASCGFELYINQVSAPVKIFDTNETVSDQNAPALGDEATSVNFTFNGVDPLRWRMNTNQGVSTTSDIAVLADCADANNCNLDLEIMLGGVPAKKMFRTNVNTATAKARPIIGSGTDTESVTVSTDGTGEVEFEVPDESIGAAEIDSGPTEDDILITKSGVMAYRSFDATDFSVGASTIVLGATVTKLGSQIGDTSAEFSNPIQFGTNTLDGDSSINIFTSIIGGQASGDDINIDGTSNVTAGTINFHTGTRTIAAAAHNMLATGSGTTTFNGTLPSVRVLFVQGTWQFDVAPTGGAGASVFNFAPTIQSGATGLDMPDINTFITNLNYDCNHATCTGIVVNNAVQNASFDADSGETLSLVRVVEGMQAANIGNNAGDAGTYTITDWTGWWMQAPMLSGLHQVGTGTLNFTRMTGLEVDDLRATGIDTFGETRSVWSKGADISLVHRGDVGIGIASGIPEAPLEVQGDTDAQLLMLEENAAGSATRGPRRETYQAYQLTTTNTAFDQVIRTFDDEETAVYNVVCLGASTTNANVSNMYTFEGGVEHTGGTLTQRFVNTTDVDTLAAGNDTQPASGEDDAGWDCAVTLSGNDFRVTVEGDTSENVEWAIFVEFWLQDGT